ncbi:hypothetical protein CWC05_22905, partial [Pseudoalteromonas ruthenica]
LSILLQAGFGFAVFKGDIPALIKTAGFFDLPHVEESGNSISNNSIDVIVKKVRADYPEHKIVAVNLYGAGYENGVAEIRLQKHHDLIPTTHVTYALKDATKLADYNAIEAPAAATYTT